MIIENLNFGKRIRKERERLGLSQAEIALAGGVSLSTQSAYEAGTRVPDLNYLARLSRVGVDPMYVVISSGEDSARSAEFNWDLLVQIADGIEYWARARNVVVPPHRTMGLARLLYPQFLAKGEVDKATMEFAADLMSFAS